MDKPVVSGFKRPISERPRSYAISSDSKRAKIEDIVRDDESIMHSFDDDKMWSTKSNTIEFVSENNVFINSLKEVNKQIQSVQYRLENMQHQINTAKTHIDLLEYHVRNNKDLVNSERTYALDTIGKMQRESDYIKIELSEAYKIISKED